MEGNESIGRADSVVDDGEQDVYWSGRDEPGSVDGMLSGDDGLYSAEEGREPGEQRDQQAEGMRRLSFDTSLPGKHTYLREKKQVGGPIDLEPGTVRSVAILEFPSMVLMPFETFPLTLTAHQFEMMTIASSEEEKFKIRGQNGDEICDCPKFFGITYNDVHTEPRHKWVATIAQVISVQNIDITNEDHLERTPVTLIAKGRYRFKFIELESDLSSVVVAKVQILGDYPPLATQSCMRENMAHAPAFVYKSFDPIQLSKQAAHLGHCLLCPYKYGALDKVEDEGFFPRTYAATLEFSYWLSRNLPVCDNERQALLEAESVPLRLLRIIDILKSQKENLSCKGCHALISNTSKVIAMSTDGTVGSFVNQHGVLHQMLTFREVSNFRLQGGPEVEHSYFPGYSWTILCCRNCYAHLGWMFNAVDKSLVPAFFYGILRKALIAQTTEDDLD
mmetsp:Transcript_2934/g.4228  ORF Transcript_2934/g.4228 Transcript_2934/m.4228 type:complete len:448 (+) Transcript_2934:74-1417(+)